MTIQFHMELHHFQSLVHKTAKQKHVSIMRIRFQVSESQRQIWKPRASNWLDRTKLIEMGKQGRKKRKGTWWDSEKHGEAKRRRSEKVRWKEATEAEAIVNSYCWSVIIVIPITLRANRFDFQDPSRSHLFYYITMSRHEIPFLSYRNYLYHSAGVIVTRFIN